MKLNSLRHQSPRKVLAGWVVFMGLRTSKSLPKGPPKYEFHRGTHLGWEAVRESLVMDGLHVWGMLWRCRFLFVLGKYPKNVGRSYKDFSFVLELAWIEPSSAGSLLRTGSLSWLLVYPVSGQAAAIRTKLLLVFYHVSTQFQDKPEIKWRQGKTAKRVLRKRLAGHPHPTKRVWMFVIAYFGAGQWRGKNAILKAGDLSSSLFCCCLGSNLLRYFASSVK